MSVTEDKETQEKLARIEAVAAYIISSGTMSDKNAAFGLSCRWFFFGTDGTFELFEQEMRSSTFKI